MRSTLPLRSRPQSPNQPRTLPASPLQTPTQPASIPTIRLISATPFAMGPAPNIGDPFIDDTNPSLSVETVSPPLPIAPKQHAQAPRKRLVPKKSKLGLLVSGKSGKMHEKNDLSDVVRRVGGSAATVSGKNGFEIHVDPAARPEVGEVLMVKKKKSRATLSGLKWGTLGEVTNAAHSKDSTQTIRVKNEDKDKWWTIGRGRKDSKDKRIAEKENTQANSPRAHTKGLGSRSRFNSLDPSIILNDFSKTSEPLLQDSNSFIGEITQPPLLAPPNSTTGSIAIRAMRSMRSVARLASWTNGKSAEKELALSTPVEKRDKEPAEVKNNRKKEKRKFEFGREQAISRLSGSSSEAGAPASLHTLPDQASTTRKHGVLGLGLPSSFRFGTVRSSSAGSSDQTSAGSAEGHTLECHGRSSSAVSVTSSTRPKSATSRISSSGSASFKWVEERIETVKVACRRDRGVKRRDEAQYDSAGLRSRGAIVDVFPEQDSHLEVPKAGWSPPMPDVTAREASAGGHFVPESESVATPCRQARARPASDQMTGKEQRSKGVRGDTDVILSALDAATNELASLISRLDLEATPSTPGGTLRLSRSFTTLLTESPYLRDSPKKRGLSKALAMRPSMASLASLRSYPQPQKQEAAVNSRHYGQQIAPWPISPPKLLQDSLSNVPSLTPSAARKSVPSSASGRDFSPTTEFEPSFVFQPLRPAKASKPVTLPPAASMSPSIECHLNPEASSARTELPSPKFRSLSKETSIALLRDIPKAVSLRKTFRKVVSTLSLNAKEIESSLGPIRSGLPMSCEAKKDLGLAGTLGGSMSSRNLEQSLNPENPDSDIPDELQDILAGADAERLGDLEDTLSYLPVSPTYLPPSPGRPPESPLPTPVASQTSIVLSNGSVISTHPVDEDEQLEYRDESDSSSLGENDTKKSFDFTGELKKLSESAGTHRLSFVEQLENAFRTPAKYDLTGFNKFGPQGENIPPVPPIPAPFLASRLVPDESSDLGMVVSASEPLLPSPEIVVSKKAQVASSPHDSSEKLFASSKPSYGQLDLNFKFGRPPPFATPVDTTSLTLSDIIPSPAHARSLSIASALEDVPPQQSTLHPVTSGLSPHSPGRRRIDSDSSSKCSMHEGEPVDARSSHARASSQTSFKGLESFDEIRRGFEFVEDRPTFYPPPTVNNQRSQWPRDSMISIASVSSYGIVTNPGLRDPFDYGYQSRPASGDMSTSLTCPRRWMTHSRLSFAVLVASASIVTPPVSISGRLEHRVSRDRSKVISAKTPPIDSASSVGSSAQTHAAYGFAGGNRSSWAPSHRRDKSVDSVTSDASTRVSRPTLGDKMLDSRRDYCLPLTSIAASPPESVTSGRSFEYIRRQGSFESMMNDDRLTNLRDSTMDQKNSRNSITSESVFGGGGSYIAYSSPGQLQMNHIRPSSLFSTEDDSTNFKRDDDTMISMIGGGRVRRCSVGSLVEGSPIFVRVGKRKVPIRSQQHNIVQPSEGLVESPNLAQRSERSPNGLGEERMTSLQQGFLVSPEEHCLSADGVDTSFMAEPVFPRPMRPSRSRSGTHSISSGVDTPPLSLSGDTSSIASDSISSIDLSRINVSLTNMSYPSVMQSRTRIRSRGHGHRRRMSGIQISRSSVYETIEEEMSVNSTPVMNYFPDSLKSPVADDNVIVVDSDDSSSVAWDGRGVAALRKYYRLKDEADATIRESKQVWLDTPLSIYAIQSFEPPAHRSGMRALLEHSRQAYGPLTAELRRFRSRTNSRPSPYPQPHRTIKVSLSPSAVPAGAPTLLLPESKPTLAPPAPASAPHALQPRAVNPNMVAEMTSLVTEKIKGDSGSLVQSRLGFNARRSATGWAKRGVGKENKETKASSLATTVPGESLRLNRPRPRGRPAPSRAFVPVG
ncbi:hypothetical protein B0F90DRAFT_1817688 [Multifurca ochricompacta]|uniref:Uncharacterized protein n=1 Tax=Multifurca ochricompacta TaxID=376703 RepID=A0AAD4QN26_9AGAM|nr:hypothetical protein B0F90DRAFT_1817688 [Multifurca ochricompacta]